MSIFDLYDIGITISMIGLGVAYIASLVTFSYVLFMNMFMEYDKIPLINNNVAHVVMELWENKLNEDLKEFAIIILCIGIGIIPASLVWPVTIPIVALMYYRNKAYLEPKCC